MKTSLIILVVLTFLLSSLLGGCGGNGGSEEEQVEGYIQVPEGPKIKVVFNGPPELEVEWEKLGMLGFQVQLIGTLRNASNKTVNFSEIGFLFDGNQVAFIQGQTIGPGEEMQITKGFPGYTENTKELEVKIVDFERVGSVYQPNASTPEPTLTYKGNSLTPEEVVVAFYGLLEEGQYDEAEKFLDPKLLDTIQKEGGLKKIWEENHYENFHVYRVEPVRDWNEKRGTYPYQVTVYYIANGDDETSSIELQQFNVEWKIVD